MASSQYGGRRVRLSRDMKWQICIAVLLLVYTIVTIYATNALWIRSRNYKSDENNHHINGKTSKNINSSSLAAVDVEVWGKAAIGLYLWEHILQGFREERLGGVWSYGEKIIVPFRFKFRTGPGVMPEKVPQGTKNLILVLNGREPKKVNIAKAWLESLKRLHELRNVAVVLLGNEQCDNEWFLWYMKKHGGPVTIAFHVYDIPYKDDDIFFQWPLGVATYRNFPNVPPLSVEVEKPRKYICNFLGTLYNGSSREVLKRIIDVYKLQESCYVKFRKSWLPKESKLSRNMYYYALINSDLTLCPVGINTECYRIYEACSYGSMPVIEDVMTPGYCGKDGGVSPLHILKKYNAPFIFIKDWTELPKIIEKERSMSLYELADRRKMILSWYNKFKERLRLHFVETLRKKFVL